MWCNCSFSFNSKGFNKLINYLYKQIASSLDFVQGTMVLLQFRDSIIWITDCSTSKFPLSFCFARSDGVKTLISSSLSVSFKLNWEVNVSIIFCLTVFKSTGVSENREVWAKTIRTCQNSWYVPQNWEFQHIQVWEDWFWIFRVR